MEMRILFTFVRGIGHSESTVPVDASPDAVAARRRVTDATSMGQRSALIWITDRLPDS